MWKYDDDDDDQRNGVEVRVEKKRRNNTAKTDEKKHKNQKKRKKGNKWKKSRRKWLPLPQTPWPHSPSPQRTPAPRGPGSRITLMNIRRHDQMFLVLGPFLSLCQRSDSSSKYFRILRSSVWVNFAVLDRGRPMLARDVRWPRDLFFSVLNH